MSAPKIINRVHTNAKKAEITRVGCYKSTLNAIRKGCAQAQQKTGIAVEPRDVLAAFGSAENLFVDIATAFAQQQGYFIKTDLHVLPPGSLCNVQHGRTVTAAPSPLPTKKPKSKCQVGVGQGSFFE